MSGHSEYGGSGSGAGGGGPRSPRGPGSSKNSGPGGPVTVLDGYVPVIDLSAAGTAIAGTPNARTATARTAVAGTDTGSDCGAGRLAVARAIGNACENSGFFTVVGHGVPQELVDDMYGKTEEFFTAPRKEKERAAGGPGTCGFRSSAGSAAKSMGVEAPADLCEIFTANVLGDHGADVRARYGDESAPWTRANVWPSQPAGFRDTWHAYMREMERLGRELMRLFALALGLDEEFFEDKVDRHVSTVVANFYYPQNRPPLPGQLRKGPHTDWGNLTILHQDDIGGLQVRYGESGWRDVPFVPGGFVINIGDMMAFWTGGRWVSTLHRVLNPERGHDRSRLSLPFFHMPNHDAVVEPLAQLGSPGADAGPVEAPGSNAGAVPATTPGQWYRDKMAATFS
ncbi:isopenicillin N synthase family dioxygenase [Streptomyces iconiensis]|uniref:2OG-Fe(II) oxygenase family protein n=1 Tax=Streptomyces iconiensis TaxID=1384038 RepID=A0ABT7A6E7_9ACTN|nr:2OG-Fe(II) oxygenase family protein [Streptomyces iconiensis]MDJ1136406.1 2OG-Fe(II) oxygenase family protein [Streptomyces iconiensis]